MGKLVSINVGTTREIGTIRGSKVISGIYKEPVSGPVKVGRLNLEGDHQADLAVHGGIDKAVYVYPSEHYEYWSGKFPDSDLPWGSFGENFTTEGLLENSIHVDDQLAAGSATFAVTQPRLPCYKLGLKFGTNTILKTFLESLRSGFYLRVTKEGECRAGDRISVIKSNGDSETIELVVRSHMSVEAPNE